VKQNLPLNHTLRVEIQRASWHNQPAGFHHNFPNFLRHVSSPYQVHFPSVLLRLGYMTTPLLNLATLASPIWPILRYLHVFSSAADLRLVSDWMHVDFHQKTLASDDFGVGFGTHVLQDIFSYTRYADGFSFRRRLHQLGLITTGHVPKKGPGKSPDFVFVTPGGRLHIVECKGSQSERSALNRALASGVAQKHSIVFANPSHEQRYISQRLVTGLQPRHARGGSPAQVMQSPVGGAHSDL
jgi:hypothetical protein